MRRIPSVPASADHGRARAGAGVSPMVAGATVATAVLHLIPHDARALDFTGAGGEIITQTVANRNKEPDPNAAVVSERYPPGIRAGNYYIYPSVGTAVVFDDNIFSDNTRKVRDISSQITPQVTFKSRLPRHVLDASVGGKIVNYLENTDQDHADLHATVDGALHVDHAHTIGLSALTTIETEDRSEAISGRNARQPVTIVRNKVSGGITRDVGRLYGTVSAGLERRDYSDSSSGDVGARDQDSRDTDQVNAMLRLGYRFSPGYAFVGEIRALQQWNRGNTLSDYDAIGYEAMAGVAFETNPIVRWRLLGGYGVRDYEQAHLPSVASSLIEGNVQWLATERLTLTASVAQSIKDVVDGDVGGVVSRTVGGKLAYELYHNLFFTLDAELKDADYIGSPRHDKAAKARLGFEYFHSTNLLFTFGYEYQVRDSNDDAFDLNQNRFTIGAKLRF